MAAMEPTGDPKQDSVYRRLQRHIDSMPVPYPATQSGVELRLLEHLFTPEEAEVALCVSAISESVEKIHKRLSKSSLSKEDLAGMLDGLVKKGAIAGGMRKGKKGMQRVYGKFPLAVGMFEMQVDKLTADYVNDFHQYMDEGFREAFLTKGTGQLRTVPIGAALANEKLVGSYDDIREYIKASDGPFAVINCVCRQGVDLLGRACAHSSIRETCLMVGSFAAASVMNRTGRRLKKQEMLELLDRADAEGMVLQPQNAQNPRFICCCCGDCCEVLTNVKKLPKPAEYFETNYFAEVDTELCTSCAKCLERCQMDAIAIGASSAEIDRDRCIGCGLCVSTCPTAAMSLKAKDRARVPPVTMGDMYRKMLGERIGPAGLMKAAAKMIFGLKL